MLVQEVPLGSLKITQLPPPAGARRWGEDPLSGVSTTDPTYWEHRQRNRIRATWHGGFLVALSLCKRVFNKYVWHNVF